jgi:hypothetical protein
LEQVAEIEDGLQSGFEIGPLKPPAIEIVPFDKAVEPYSRVAARQAKAKLVLSFEQGDRLKTSPIFIEGSLKRKHCSSHSPWACLWVLSMGSFG